MKSILFRVCLLAFLAVSACKKEKEDSVVTPTAPQPDAQTLAQVEDDNDVKNEGDDVNSDVIDALSSFTTINGRAAVTSTRKCGYTVDSIGPQTIRLTYDGITPCLSPSRTRAGTITFQLVQGQQWRFPGSVIRITINNFTVVRLRDQKSWTYNGTKFITNVRGHLNWPGYLAGTDSLLYRERATGMTVRFSDNQTATYNIARTTTWRLRRYANRDVIQFAAMGDSTVNGKPNVDTWGTGRSGNAFTNQYLTRLLSDNYCWFWRPKSGTIQHTQGNNTVTLTMGVNESGQFDTRDCAYGWKINWALASGGTGEKIISY